MHAAPLHGGNAAQRWCKAPPPPPMCFVLYKYHLIQIFFIIFFTLHYPPLLTLVNPSRILLRLAVFLFCIAPSMPYKTHLLAAPKNAVICLCATLSFCAYILPNHTPKRAQNGLELLSIFNLCFCPFGNSPSRLGFRFARFALGSECVYFLYICSVYSLNMQF